jgi:hypothetical protein
MKLFVSLNTYFSGKPEEPQLFAILIELTKIFVSSVYRLGTTSYLVQFRGEWWSHENSLSFQNMSNVFKF